MVVGIVDHGEYRGYDIGEGTYKKRGGRIYNERGERTYRKHGDRKVGDIGEGTYRKPGDRNLVIEKLVETHMVVRIVVENLVI